MVRRGFSVGEAIQFGWDTTIHNLGFLVVVVLVVALTEGIPAGLSRAVAGSSPGLSSVLSLIGSILEIIVGIGVIRIALRLVDHQPVELGDLFSTTATLFLNYLAASILEGIIVTIGFILLIVPGIFLAIRLSLTPFVVVGQQAGPIAALKESWRLTQGSFWKLFLLAIASLVIIIVGAVLLLIGLFVAYPLTLLAWAYVYRTLQTDAGGMMTRST
jgi:uncharacterized membrane protein